MGLKLPKQWHNGKTYDNAFSISFTIQGCRDPEGETVTPQEFREAILLRLASIDDQELIEAIGVSYDSVEEEEEEATIDLVNHDMTDLNFQKLIKKLKLKAKNSDDETTVTGNAKDIKKMLSTMYGNDWKDMFKQKGQKFEEDI